MKKKTILLLLGTSVITLSSCGKKEAAIKIPKADTIKVLTADDINKKKKRTDIINNLMIGRSKISFNNQEFSQLSDGKFTSQKLWGTFRNLDDPSITLQLNAADNNQSIYGEISGYELEGIDWDKETPVKYLGLMEEALQGSKDQTALLYKGRTGDVIFSVALMGKEPLTEENKLLLKSIAKEIKIEFIGE
ncbi:hypothetical protein [Vagococcus silagei]|uniref:Lipoprotein n=1 Tax=Vagococcus silagei TaxID=2508885 RepID=A0A4S3B796_9ENTE|nr:hypothetical protein [Vagococcus silagei]THB61900.1 hypothetical protein ESZ54_02745 [Vagococcus silagei]